MQKDQEWIREWAEVQIAQVNHLHESLLEQHSALFRWILAARLSANGGGAVAVLNLDKGPEGFSIIAIVFFVIGAILSIFCAEQDQKTVEAGISPNLAMLGFWVKTRVTGQFDESKMKELIADASHASVGRPNGKNLGHASIALFIGGVALIVIGMVDWPSAAAFLRQCIA